MILPHHRGQVRSRGRMSEDPKRLETGNLHEKNGHSCPAWFDSTEGLESSFHCAPSPRNVFIDLRDVATGTSPPRHCYFPQVRIVDLVRICRILLQKLLANAGKWWQMVAVHGSTVP